MVSTRSRPYPSPTTSVDRLPRSSWTSNTDYIINNRASILVDDDEITAQSVSDLDPETDRLLPTRRPRRRRQHRVRIQGRVALVRAVSVADLRQANVNTNANTNANTNVNATGKIRATTLRTDVHTNAHKNARNRAGLRTNRGDVPFVVIAGTDDCDRDDEDGDEEDHDRVVGERDSEFRGYGIGGAGNIRMHENFPFLSFFFLLLFRFLNIDSKYSPCFIIRPSLTYYTVPCVHDAHVCTSCW
jgi:hypothetical protein